MAMPNLCGAAAVKVGDASAGVMLWPPKKIYLPPALLKGGMNVIGVAVHNTLANHVRSEEFKAVLRDSGAAENVYFRMTDVADRRRTERERVVMAT